MDDCLIIGGGVIGLSLAYELACQGMRARVVDRGEPGREASWAAAGILPPAACRAEDHPLEQLTGMSHELHRQWAVKLREESGIDYGYQASGGIHFARDAADECPLRENAAQLQRRGLGCEELTRETLAEKEPALAGLARQGTFRVAYFLPDEVQIRSPRYLKALLAACLARGVSVQGGIEVADFEVRGRRIDAVRTNSGAMTAGNVCVATGSWGAALMARLGTQAVIKPIRGQIALIQCTQPPIKRIIYEGRHYMVARADGRLLVGSTEEDVGFDRRTTAEAIADLIQFTAELVPSLRGLEIEKTWAGLRPGTFDGMPYIGRVPDIDNAFVAAGHFRSGLHLSPATAIVITQLIRGQTPQVDLTPFRLNRG